MMECPRKRVAPDPDAGKPSQDAEIPDLVEGIEISEHRAENDINQAELFSSEIRPGTELAFKPHEFVAKGRDLCVERLFAGCRIEPGDVVEDS